MYPRTCKAPHFVSLQQMQALDGYHKSGPAARVVPEGSGLSVGGVVLPPPGYLCAVYSAVRQAGGLCIADEVQVCGGGECNVHTFVQVCTHFIQRNFY